MITNNAKIYLCRPDRTPICELNGKQIDSVKYERNLKDYNTLELNVDRYIDIDGVLVESNGYNRLKNHMLLYIEDTDFFQLDEPTLQNDGNENEYKSLTAYSDEKSLEDKDLKGLLFNKGTTDSLEMLATNNVDELGYAKEFITFCNDDNHELSLIHLVLEHVPGWSVGYIDPAIKNQKYSFEAQNTNVYAFLTTDVANVVECVFYFNTILRTVSAYYKNNIGLNTNIFVGWRNLLNTLSITPQQDTLYNALTVQGDDSLDIRSVNFGDSKIYNLDYYLNTTYFKEETINKVKAWIKYREDNRDQYVEYSKADADYQQKIDDLMYRVPNDGCDTDQYETMDLETLQNTLKMYQKMLEVLQLSVDTRDDYEKDSSGNFVKWDNPDDLQNRVYKPWKTSEGEVDHEKYLGLLYDATNGYGGYYTYIELNEYIIPNITIAINNYQVPEDDRQDYNEAFETNWDLYGLVELEGKRDTFNKELLGVLASYEKPWSDLTDEEKEEIGIIDENYYNTNHELYQKYKNYLGDENTPGSLLYKIKQLQDEIDELKESQEANLTQMNNMADLADLKNDQYGLTDSEYIAVQSVIREGDYTNTNIFITSLNDSVSAYEQRLELLNDGIKKISECSQPQYQVATTLDNLLSINEYADVQSGDSEQGWWNDFDIGNFITIGVREDYIIRLRLLSFTYNPCTKNATIEVTYTNMVNSLSGRDDYLYLFDNSVSSAKNSISVGTGDASDSVEYMTDVLTMLTQSQIFGNTINNSVSDILNGSGYLDSLIGEYLRFHTINVGNLIGTDGQFETLFSKYINSEYINSHIILGDIAEFDELTTNVANIKEALIGTSATETGLFISLSAANAKIDEAWISNIVANQLHVGDLLAGDITISDQMRILSQNGNMIMNGNTMQFLNPEGEVGIQIGYGNGENPSIIIKDENGTALWTSTGVTQDAIADGLIVNDMISNGTIEKDKLGFSVVEANEHGGVDITQVYLGDGNQLGIDYTQFKTNTNSSLSNLQESIDSLSTASDNIELIGSQVFTVDNEGNISPDSITITAQCKNNATISKWFIDDVENTSYISQDKLSITIPSSYMYDKKKIDIKVQNLTGSIYDIMSVYKVTDGKNGENSVFVQLTSSEGQIFKNGDSIPVNSTITCNVYRGNEEITPNWYKWFKKSDDDPDWQQLSQTSKTISISLSDFVVQTRIKCQVDI